jgi:hypothetical protein
MARHLGKIAVLCIAVLAADAGAQRQAPKPGPELKLFEVAIGTWRFEGEVKPSPFGPGGKVSGTERYEWMPGGFFMQLNRDGKGPLGDFKTHIIFSYDPITKKYTGTLFDNSGAFESSTVSIDGNVWHWTGNGHAGDGKPVHERCTMTYSPNGASMDLKCEASADAKVWAPEFEANYTKLK